MNSSQTGLQLRQRGMAIAAGGLVLQLIGVLIIFAGGSAAVVPLIPLLIAAVATVRTYTGGKDRTGTATTASLATIVFGLVATFVVSVSGMGILLIVVGVVVLYFGNKQLAAGVKS